MTGLISPEELAALETLARNRRLVVLIVPEGVPADAVRALSEEINGRLEDLAAKRISRDYVYEDEGLGGT